MEKRSITGKYTQDDKFLNALAEAFRLQEAILNTTDLAIFSTTPEGIINTFNHAAELLLGYSSEELIGKCSPLVFHELNEVIGHAQKTMSETGRTVEPVFDVFIIKINEQQAYRDEWTFIRKDGSRFPGMLSLSALRDEKETVIGYIGVITDLSLIKSTAASAKASEQKFKTLAENIPGAIYLCEANEPFSTLYVNDQIEAITGYPADDFLTNKVNITQLYHPDDVDTIRQQVETALREKSKYTLRYRLKHRSGNWRWIAEAGIGVYEGDQLLMLEGFLTDVTAQREAEENLQKIAEENLRVFNSAVTLNVVAGFDGYFRRVSVSSVSLLGWTEEEMKAKPYFSFVHPDDLTRTQEAARYISEGNNLLTFENRYRCKDGSYRWLLWSSASDPRRHLMYASGIDITERKKSEESLLNSKKNLEAIAIKLQEQNKQLDEFAHIISHNFRSPLGNIQALVSLLNENSSMEDYKLIFGKLKKLAKNLGDTMNDLMDTLKAKTQTNQERVEIRFKEVLDKVTQSLEGELILAGASVTFDFNAAPTIHYPKAYIESVFQNLLSNALKYRAPDRRPEIHFKTQPYPNTIELRVADNGQGIDLEKFGDKLFGLHRTFHSHQEARGVGLFLIKTQIESMGGSITAESEVGKGTTFIIRF